MLAAVMAVKTFHPYLHGLKFKLVTDHQPLTWLMTKQDLVNQHARWAMMLQQYDFTIEHRPGANHQNADALSHFPLASEEDVTEARLDTVSALTLHIRKRQSDALTEQLAA